MKSDSKKPIKPNIKAFATAVKQLERFVKSLEDVSTEGLKPVEHEKRNAKLEQMLTKVKELSGKSWSETVAASRAITDALNYLIADRYADLTKKFDEDQDVVKFADKRTKELEALSDYIKKTGEKLSPGDLVLKITMRHDNKTVFEKAIKEYGTEPSTPISNEEVVRRISTLEELSAQNQIFSMELSGSKNKTAKYHIPYYLLEKHNVAIEAQLGELSKEMYKPGLGLERAMEIVDLRRSLHAEKEKIDGLISNSPEKPIEVKVDQSEPELDKGPDNKNMLSKFLQNITASIGKIISAVSSLFSMKKCSTFQPDNIDDLKPDVEMAVGCKDAILEGVAVKESTNPYVQNSIEDNRHWFIRNVDDCLMASSKIGRQKNASIDVLKGLTAELQNSYAEAITTHEAIQMQLSENGAIEEGFRADKVFQQALSNFDKLEKVMKKAPMITDENTLREFCRSASPRSMEK